MDIKALREGLGLTQAQFAAKLGTSQAYIGHIENGRRRPSLKLALRMEKLSGEQGVVSEVIADKLRAAHESQAG